MNYKAGIAFTLFLFMSTGAMAAGPYSFRTVDQMAYDMADVLKDNLTVSLNKTRPILYTTFVHMDNLETASSFGRLIGDQVASRFSQYGYKIIEIRLRKNQIKIKEGFGETTLSRDIGEISTNHNAQAVLVGTYSVSEPILYLTAKLVHTKDQSVLSSGDLAAYLNDSFRTLLNGFHQRDFTKGISPKAFHQRPPVDNFEQADPKITETDIEKGPLSKGLVLLQPTLPLAARIIQNRLAILGYYMEELHGKWDSNTLDALKRFKNASGLSSDDKWDINTQKNLFKGTGQ